MKNSIPASVYVDILLALKQIGADEVKSIEFTSNDYGDRIEINIDGSYFGIWDTEKKTFVD